MKHKTQAVGLLHMVKAHSVYDTHTLALPLFQVSKKRLKTLNTEDVILIGLDSFKGVLVKDGMLCADTILGAQGLQITHVMQEALDLEESKKHVAMMFVCANVKLNRLEVGQIIEVEDLEQVDVISEGKKIAKGSLVCVNNEIAVKINKVLK